MFINILLQIYKNERCKSLLPLSEKQNKQIARFRSLNTLFKKCRCFFHVLLTAVPPKKIHLLKRQTKTNNFETRVTGLVSEPGILVFSGRV